MNGASQWCGLGNTGTKYYIYDKTGTHLLQSGTKCIGGTIKCWMVLPPNQDYILRIGGALDPARAGFTASFCGYACKLFLLLLFYYYYFSFSNFYKYI